MNWEKANVITKGVLYILIRAALLGGAVFAALVIGALTYALEFKGTDNAGLASLFGLCSGVAIYLGGIAGREHVRPFLARHLLPPPPVAKDTTPDSPK